MSELLPCPFCGQPPITGEIAGHPVVRCGSWNCPGAGFGWSPAAWNTRAPIAGGVGRVNPAEYPDAECEFSGNRCGTDAVKCDLDEANFWPCPDGGRCEHMKGRIIGWRMVDGVRVFQVLPATPGVQPFDVVRWPLAAVAPAIGADEGGDCENCGYPLAGFKHTKFGSEPGWCTREALRPTPSQPTTEREEAAKWYEGDADMAELMIGMDPDAECSCQDDRYRAQVRRARLAAQALRQGVSEVQLADALQAAWDDPVADAGVVPDAFRIEYASARTRVVAKFAGTDFVKAVRAALKAAWGEK